MKYYPLGLTKTPREVMLEAYGAAPHPLTPESVEVGRLKKDPTICYELSRGEAYGKHLYTLSFAQVVNGKGTPMRDASKSFEQQSAVAEWLALIERSGNVS
jgi:hypothetical protein